MPFVLALAAASAPIDYRVSLSAGREAPTVSVAMTFTGDADGETEIDLPARWAGSAELWRALGRPEVRGSTLADGGTPERWRLRHLPNARITLRYTVADGRPGVPDAATHEKARPAIERDWLAIHAQGAIAVPHGRDAAPARFAFGPVAPGWQLVSDLTRPGPLTAGQVAEGMIVGGTALRVATRRVGTGTLKVAIVGAWPFADAALEMSVAQLMRTENAMLAAPDIDFLVTLTPLAGSASGAISHGGTGTTGGFAMEATDNVPLDELTRTLAHEYAHRWFGRGFGPVDDGAGPYWFTEGVNDWFAARAMVRALLWSNADWARQLNMVLRRYGASTARALSDADLSAQFWTNPDAMQVQYDRGFLAALLLDRQVPLLPVLRRMAREPATASEDRRFTALAGTEDVATARAATARPLAADVLAPCGSLLTVTRPAYDRGFDADDARTVTAVRTRAARDAGIRPGMRYVRRIAFEHLDSTVPWVAEFADGAGLRTLRWLPAGDASVTFQQLDSAAIDTVACDALIAGAPATP
jgi:hypothetical protein